MVSFELNYYLFFMYYMNRGENYFKKKICNEQRSSLWQMARNLKRVVRKASELFIIQTNHSRWDVPQ